MAKKKVRTKKPRGVPLPAEAQEVPGPFTEPPGPVASRDENGYLLGDALAQAPALAGIAQAPCTRNARGEYCRVTVKIEKYGEGYGGPTFIKNSPWAMHGPKEAARFIRTHTLFSPMGIEEGPSEKACLFSKVTIEIEQDGEDSIRANIQSPSMTPDVAYRFLRDYTGWDPLA